MNPLADTGVRLSFGWQDWLIIALYLLMLLGIGAYHARRQRTIKEYFLAGKHMGWLPLGLSLMAALNSGIDYIAQPSAFLKYGIIIIIGSLSWLVLYPYAFFVTMPMYRRLDVYSAYEYLENRFNVAVRCLAAVIFILWRLGWMATALYAPCIAFHTATGGQLPLKPMILVLGVVATIYTMMGGIKAVIWTEVIQFVVMFGGLLLTCTIIFMNVSIDPAQFWQAAFRHHGSAMVTSAPADGILEQLVELFRRPVTWYGILLAVVIGRLPVYTSDQVMVQRFQTSRSIRDLRQGFIITAVSDAIWMITLTFVGVALSLYFGSRRLPDWVATPDQYFPYFMALVFPRGATGPVIAAIIAASLSAIASAINSQSAVVFVDFYSRLVKGRRRPLEEPSPAEQRMQIRLSRIASVVAGLTGTLIATQLDRLGTVWEIANIVIQTPTGPILAIFWLGMFTRRVDSTSAFVAGLFGTGVGIYVAFFSSLSFLWPSVLSFGSALLLGVILGCFQPVTQAAMEWNWFAICRRPLPK